MQRSFYPDFLRDFSCKCGACRRTCCRHDWNVLMSKDEYEANMDTGLGAELHGLAVAHMRPNPAASGDADFAYVQMEGDVDCPFLEASGLCVWRRLRGAHIGATCINFPNTCVSFLGDEYLLPTGGCEAVLEALVGRDEPIRMESAPLGQEVRRSYATIDEQTVRERPLLEHYPALIEFGLATLQDRRYRLDDRMALLVDGLSQVARMEDAGRIDGLPDLLQTLSRPESRAERLGRMACVQPVPWLAVFACGEMLSHFTHSSAHAPTAQRMAAGLGIAMSTTTDAEGKPHHEPRLASPQLYPTGRAAMEGFFARREVFLEHVMASLYLKMLMPIREPGVWSHALYFAAVYAFVKGGLVGLFSADEPEGPDDERLVDALVETIRMATHSELMYPLTVRRLKDAGIDNPQAAVALVRA